MSLFDVLNSSGLKSTLDAFSDKAGKAVSTVSSQTPGGLGGLLGAGALGALLGMVASRSVLEKVALVGAGAVIGNFYQKWSRNSAQQSSAQGNAPQNAEAVRADDTAMLMLRTMVYAARADGHIDEAERERIRALTEQLFPGRDVSPLMNDLMSEPIHPDLLAVGVQTPEQGEDLYRLSCFIVDIDHFMEKSYLEALAAALHIPAERRTVLEQEAVQAKRKLIAG